MEFLAGVLLFEPVDDALLGGQDELPAGRIPGFPNHLRALAGIGKTADNLAAAMSGEAFEATTMYPEYVKAAEEDGEKAAVMTTNNALAAEKVHYEMYKRAGQTVSVGKDLEVKPIHVCGVCGFTMEGDAPDNCPVCGAPKAKFVKF